MVLTESNRSSYHWYGTGAVVHSLDVPANSCRFQRVLDVPVIFMVKKRSIIVTDVFIDRGERTSMSSLLTGKKVLIAGASGEVGRGAAFALASAGAIVTLAGRSLDKLEAVQKMLPGESHTVIAVDYSSAEGALQLASQLSDQKFDVVVSSSGPWWPINKLSDADPAVLQKAVSANFQAQLNLYSTLASRCTETYLMVNGSAALGLPQSGLTGVLANACVGAASVMYAECQADSSLPDFAHVLINSSVGHAQFRQETIDPNEFGQVFVAMVLNKHSVDDKGTVFIDDGAYKKLASMI